MPFIDNLDEDTATLLARLTAQTGLQSYEIMNRLLSSHLLELHELNEFLKAQVSNAPSYEAGANLLISYGPESIVTGIKRIMPGYQLLNEKFEADLAESLTVSVGMQ